MNYGFFDEKKKEYVVTKPNTPTPWCNYLGSPEYGAIISNNAAGYSFAKSGAMGRLTRFRFNSLLTNLPGRYIYIKDREKDDFWSASWQPVAKSPDEYKSECRHGTAYTNIKSEYDDIETNTLYYVPLNKAYEVWNFKVKNTGIEERKLSVFGFVEFTNDSNYEQDTVNLQYTQFISKTYYKGNMIIQTINENVSEVGGDTSGLSDEAGDGIYRFFGAAGEKAVAYDGDRDTFIGDYRNYGNPVMVQRGKCSNTLNYNCNSCGAMQFDIDLKPGEEKIISFVLGEGNEVCAGKIIDKYKDNSVVASELLQLKDYWHTKLNRLQVKTPDDNFNNSINVWNSYQCFITFIWSRAASFIYCGLRNGLGYRDTVQDIQGIVHLDSELALERLRFMLSAQTSNGGGLPLVKFDHNPGKELTPDDEDYGKQTGHYFYRADDALWLFPTTLKYMKTTGNWNFIDEIIPYADKEDGTVYDHLRRAIQFSLDRLGEHGLPVGLHADWNDCLRLGYKGESIFVTFQLYLAIKIFKELAEKKNDAEQIKWSGELLKDLDLNIQKYAFEDDQFVRGITEDGYIVGSKRNDEGNIWLNPQTWAVISGAAKDDQSFKIMDTVNKKLNTDYGAMLFNPPFKKYGLPVARMTLFNPSTKENAGIFSQSQGWLVLAEALIGNGNRAYEYYKKCNPASMNDKAEIRKIEPYVHGQSIESIHSPFEGRAHVAWLTGTASTVMVGVIEGILGIKPEFDGMKIDPCIPSEWKEFSMVHEFREKWLNIKVENKDGVQKGVQKIILNGETILGNFILESKLKPSNEILVIMGN